MYVIRRAAACQDVRVWGDIIITKSGMTLPDLALLTSLSSEHLTVHYQGIGQDILAEKYSLGTNQSE